MNFSDSNWVRANIILGWHVQHAQPAPRAQAIALIPRMNSNSHEQRATSTGQLHVLITQLERICQVVHPYGRNLKSYGHEIRNVLILACTEVEAHCKNILRVNGEAGENMHDYVRLAEAMKLYDYEVSANYYPWFDILKPFGGWATLSHSPSKDLRWYAAYNNTKHDRERNFQEATLQRAFDAVAACFVLICAQYGWDFALTDKDGERAYFQLKTAPRWEPRQLYVPPFGKPWSTRNYPFER